jgi:hypothetical protein
MLSFRRFCCLFMVVVFVFFCLGCGKAQKTENSDTAAVKEQPLVKRVEKQAKQKSTFEKIDEALQKGEITEKESAILYINSVYNKNKIPEKFKNDSSIAKRPDLSWKVQWIRENFNSLNDKEKQALKPFTLPPDNPESIFSPENQNKKNILDQLLSVNKAYAAEPWKEITFSSSTRPNAVVIKYYVNEDMDDFTEVKQKKQAELVKKAIEDSWGKFKTLLDFEPNKKITFYLGSDIEEAYGMTNFNRSTLECEVKIAPFLIEKLIKATTAHELFHCFQIQMEAVKRGMLPDTIWLLEATAVWSENFIYPKYNTEHEYLPEFFKGLEYPMILQDNRYANYVFFYFLSQYTGNNQCIPDVIKRVKTQEVREFLPSVIPEYETAFYMYSGYNYNKDPMKLYRDDPKFSDLIPTARKEKLEKSGKFEIAEVLEKGAISYMIFDISQDTDKVADIVFTFPGNNDTKLKRRALIKIAGEWRDENWSDITRRKFCQKDTFGKAEQIVLISSYSNLKNLVIYDYDVEVFDKCDDTFSGYIKMSSNMNGPSGFNNSSALYSRELLQFNPDQNAYVITRRMTDYRSQGSFATRFIVGPQGNEMDLGPVGSADKASGFLDESYGGSDNMPVRIRGSKSEGYRLFLFPDTKNKQWITNIKNTVIVNTNSMIIKKDSGTAMSAIPDEIRIEDSEIINNKIKGSRSYNYSTGGGTVTGTVVFEFDLP